MVASHDLRSPIRQVRSFAMLLGRRLAGKLDDEATEFLRHLDESAESMDELVTHLLTYSRLGNELQSEPVRLRDMIAKAQVALGDTLAGVSLRVTGEGKF